MPRRDDIESICVIGSGPIVIGQACEFDYAGCQALKVLREDGFRTIVVNSNPATIMTDPGFADRTYIEPLDVEGVADVLGRERPDALLPTMGGQTGLNLAAELAADGLLDALGIERAGVIGHDWGGFTAYLLGLRHPDRISGIVVCNSPHPWATPDVRAVLELQREPDGNGKPAPYATRRPSSSPGRFSSRRGPPPAT